MPLPNVKIEPDTGKLRNPSRQRDLDRPSANEIYQQVSRNARRAIARPVSALAVSGVVGAALRGSLPQPSCIPDS